NRRDAVAARRADERPRRERVARAGAVWLVAGQGSDAMLGMRGQIGGDNSADPRATGRPLAAGVTALPPQTAWGRKRPHRPSPVTSLAQVYLGQEPRFGPVNVLAWRERDDDGTVVRPAVMTTLPATAQPKADGARRMGSATVVRAWQRRGFHLDATGLADTDRVVRWRLVLVLAIAYLWLVSVGRWVVKRGDQRMIEDGRGRQWHFSRFQVGVGWKEHR
ncbi:MAG: hypothetical protein RMJ54_19175, partial [Roseiflexaceae bacterium]|nr:hypothetical protein [Roseiflexaceae bacterium]